MASGKVNPVRYWLTDAPHTVRTRHMATSYKNLWQEANEEIDRLQARLYDLRRLNDELAVALTSSRAVLATTPQIVDLAGIARHMRVDRLTPQQWKQRKYLPPVDFPEIKEPLWLVSSIIDKFVNAPMSDRFVAGNPPKRIWYDDLTETALSPTA